MYKDARCLLVYLLALVLLLVGAWLQADWTVYLMVLVFLFWDARFVLTPTSFEGRSTKKILSHCRDAETLMSYFIGFYSVVLAVIFTDNTKTDTLLRACRQANLSILLVAAPLVVAAIPMLFIPVQFGAKGTGANAKREITSGVKALLFVNIYCEKLVVFMFVHDLLRILRRFF
jgi:hypothetical protein